MIGWFGLGLWVVMGVGRVVESYDGDGMAEDREILVENIILGGMVKS